MFQIKGRPDPYAFVPLDPGMLNRRRKHQAEHQVFIIIKNVSHSVITIMFCFFSV